MTTSIGVRSNGNIFTQMAVCLLLILAAPSWAVTSTEVAKLVQSDAAVDDFFGFSYSIDGDTVILGAYHDDDFPDSSGSAYVFVRNTAEIQCPETSLIDPWCQEAKLAPLDPEAFEWFGYAVAVSGDTAVVTARRDDNNTDDGAKFRREGSAYVFVRSGTVWTQQAKLRANDLSEDPWFGTHADLEGDTLVVGARKDDQRGIDAGAVYVFTRTGTAWSQQAKLMASDGEAGDLFGTFVSLDGNLLAIGAHGNDDDGAGSGSAYVFVRDGTNWSQEAKLTADDAAAGDLFGIRLALSGNTVIVGSPQYGVGPGAAYVFGRYGSAWSQQAKLTPSDGFAGDGYGFTVGLLGNIALVGADTDDDQGFESGSVYVYSRTPTGWSEEAKLLASDGSADNWFGSGFSMSGDTAVVAALPIFTSSISAAYVLEFDIDDDGYKDSLDNCPITPNPGQPDSNGNGIGDECDIGATQTFGDNGSPYNGDGLSCSSCLGNGWTFNVGGLVPDAGEDGTGDVALLYDNGSVSGYHLQAWDGFPRIDTRVIGDLANAHAAVLRFRARHSGVGDGVTLRAYIFNFHDDRFDGALSNTAASIANTDTTWQTYTISIDPASLEAFPFDELNPRTLTETLSDVSVFGLRHDPGFTGPGTPAPIAAAVFFDDIELLLDGDEDGDVDEADNCPIDANASQSDIDLDGAGDLCDPCPSVFPNSCDPDASAAEEIDPAAGGTVETPDGEFAMDIDPGDLPDSEGTSVSVTDAQPTDPNVDLSIGANANAGTSLGAWDLGPDGLILDNPIVVRLAIDVTALNENQRSKLDVYRLNESTGKFEPLGATCNVSEDPPSSGTFIGVCEFELLSFSVYAMVAPLDADADGVPDNFEDVVDLCPSTDLPETVVPTRGQLGNNKWALRNGNGTFVQGPPQAGSVFSFDIADTHGCTCEQIIEAAGLGRAHTKNGCSTSAMLNWINNP